jgi:hypothetical protein
MTKTLLVNVVAGVPIYCLVPASGPHYAYPDFPNILPALTPQAIALTDATNCVPSTTSPPTLLVSGSRAAGK